VQRESLGRNSRLPYRGSLIPPCVSAPRGEYQSSLPPHHHPVTSVSPPPPPFMSRRQLNRAALFAPPFPTPGAFGSSTHARTVSNRHSDKRAHLRRDVGRAFGQKKKRKKKKKKSNEIYFRMISFTGNAHRESKYSQARSPRFPSPLRT